MEIRLEELADKLEVAKELQAYREQENLLEMKVFLLSPTANCIV